MVVGVLRWVFCLSVFCFCLSLCFFAVVVVLVCLLLLYMLSSLCCCCCCCCCFWGVRDTSCL